MLAAVCVSLCALCVWEPLSSTEEQQFDGAPTTAIATTVNTSMDSDDEFEKELDRREQGWLATAVQHVTTEEDVANNAVDAIIETRRVKGKTVFDVLQVFPENVRQHCAAISGLPVTQVSVERLFSALKLLLTDTRSRLKDDDLQAVLFLRVRGIK